MGNQATSVERDTRYKYYYHAIDENGRPITNIEHWTMEFERIQRDERDQLYNEMLTKERQYEKHKKKTVAMTKQLLQK